MTLLQQSLLVGLMVGLGIALLLWRTWPHHPSLHHTLPHLTPTTLTDASVDTRRAHRLPTDASMEHRLGAWLSTNLPAWAHIGVPTHQLQLARIPLYAYMGERLAFALAGFLAPLFLSLFAALLGVAVAVPLPVIGSILLAIAASFIPNATLRVSTATSDKEIVDAVAVYADLVASQREAGLGTAQALEEAAAAPSNWVFVRLREELQLAKLTGATPWDALHRLASEWRSEELRAVADIVKVSSNEGTSIVVDLRERAAAARTLVAADQTAAANKATEKLTFPMTLLAMVFLTITVTPGVINVLTTT